MHFLEENNIDLESSPIYDNNPYPNSYSVPQEINIIPKEDCFIYVKNDDNFKYDGTLNIFNEKKTIDNSKDVGLIEEKNLFFIDNERKNDKVLLFQNNFPIIFKTQKEKLNEEPKKVNLCRQKRVRDEDVYESHNKFSDDILRRKCKYLVLKNMFEFLNKQIKIVYKGNLGHSIFKKELKIINQEQVANSNIEFNKNFLTKKICDIFSEDISNKYTNFQNSHNKNLIYKLMNENDENKKIYFEKLFNLNFIQCLKYFSGEEHNELLKGLKCFKDIKNEIIKTNKDDEVEYYNILEYYLKHYEEIIKKKRSRKPNK